jgi:UrcA family protein
MKRLLTIAAAGLVFTAGAASAEAPVDRKSTTVAYLDLDLGSRAGRATLERRIDQAVKRVCGTRPSPREMTRSSMHRACLAEAREGSRQQVAALFRNEALAENAIQVTGAVR